MSRLFEGDWQGTQISATECLKVSQVSRLIASLASSLPSIEVVRDFKRSARNEIARLQSKNFS